MRDPRCSYVVFLESTTPAGPELREFASYLTGLAIAGCDVIVLDPGPRESLESRTRVLRWVGRHLRMPQGVDRISAAASLAACEKVIVAAPDVRYTPEALGQIWDLLEVHPVVEPQCFPDPMPWWGGIEAGRMLIHRAVDARSGEGATFGFRRSGGVSPVRSRKPGYFAKRVLVGRQAGAFARWLSGRPHSASEDFALPVKTAFFLALMPLLILLAVLGGVRAAGGYAGVIAFSSVALAIRGRSGTSALLPLRTCFFAPVWILERSLSVYWALFRKLRNDLPPHPAEVLELGSGLEKELNGRVDSR